MDLRWERTHSSLYRCFSGEGHELAQVGHVAGPDGADWGWTVWLTLERGEMFDRHPTAAHAMAAAERILLPDR